MTLSTIGGRTPYDRSQVKKRAKLAAAALAASAAAPIVASAAAATTAPIAIDRTRAGSFFPLPRKALPIVALAMLRPHSVPLLPSSLGRAPVSAPVRITAPVSAPVIAPESLCGSYIEVRTNGEWIYCRVLKQQASVTVTVRMPDPEHPDDPDRSIDRTFNLNDPNVRLSSSAARDARVDKNFREDLVKYGFEVVDVAGDGNCLFGSVARHLLGDAALHPQIRRECCDSLGAGFDKYSNFITATGAGRASRDTYAQYVENMRQPRVWGDNVEVSALLLLPARLHQIRPHSPA